MFQRSEDHLRRHHRSLVSTLAGMYFSNDVRIKNCIVHYEQTLDEAICDCSYEKSLSFHGHLH